MVFREDTMQALRQVQADYYVLLEFGCGSETGLDRAGHRIDGKQQVYRRLSAEDLKFADPESI